jgi:hypothetical protein
MTISKVGFQTSTRLPVDSGLLKLTLLVLYRPEILAPMAKRLGSYERYSPEM